MTSSVSPKDARASEGILMPIPLQDTTLILFRISTDFTAPPLKKFDNNDFFGWA